MHFRRYALLGTAVGLVLPVLASLVEANLRYGGDLLQAQSSSPLLWMIDATPLVFGFLAALAGRRQDQIATMERLREQGFLATAGDLSTAARALLSTVQSFSSMTADTAATVKETTHTMSGLSQTAMQAALSAETVIGLAQRSRQSSEEGLQAVEMTCTGMAKLAEEVRALSGRIEALNARIRDIFAVTAVVAQIAEGSERLASRAEAEAEATVPSAEGFAAVARELRRHATEARNAAVRVQGILAEIHRAMLAALTAVEVGSQRAESGAAVAAGTGETIRKLAATIRDTSDAAKQIATVAQQQDRGIDEVLKAMNQIYRAVEEGVVATQQVAFEVKVLNALADGLKRQVHQ